MIKAPRNKQATVSTYSVGVPWFCEFPGTDGSMRRLAREDA